VRESTHGNSLMSITVPHTPSSHASNEGEAINTKPNDDVTWSRKAAPSSIAMNSRVPS